MPSRYLAHRPVGPYRDIRTVAIGAEDFELESGFTCQAATAGNLTYRPFLGREDVTENGLAAGDTITGPGDVPVLMRAVRASSTVASVVIGIP